MKSVTVRGVWRTLVVVCILRYVIATAGYDKVDVNIAVDQQNLDTTSYVTEDLKSHVSDAVSEALKDVNTGSDDATNLLFGELVKHLISQKKEDGVSRTELEKILNQNKPKGFDYEAEKRIIDSIKSSLEASQSKESCDCKNHPDCKGCSSIDLQKQYEEGKRDGKDEKRGEVDEAKRKVDRLEAKIESMELNEPIKLKNARSDERKESMKTLDALEASKDAKYEASKESFESEKRKFDNMISDLKQQMRHLKNQVEDLKQRNIRKFDRLKEMHESETKTNLEASKAERKRLLHIIDELEAKLAEGAISLKTKMEEAHKIGSERKREEMDPKIHEAYLKGYKESQVESDKTIKELRNAMLNLKNKLSDALDDHTKLSQARSEGKQKGKKEALSELESLKLKAKQEGIAEAEKDALIEAHKEKSVFESATKKLEDHIQDLNTHITKLKEELKSMRTKLEEETLRANNAEKDLNNSKIAGKHNLKLQLQLDDALQKITLLEKSIAEKDTEINTLKEKLAESQETINKLKMKSKAHFEHISKLEEELQSQKTDYISKLKKEQTLYSKSKETYLERIKQLTDDIDRLRKELETERSNLQAAESRANEAHKALQDALLKTTSKNNDHATLSSELENMNKKIIDLEKSIAVKDTEISRLNDLVKELRTKVSSLEAIIETKDKEIASLESSLKSNKSELLKKTELVNTLKKDVKVKDVKITDLNSEIETQNNKISIQDKNLTSLSKKVEDLLAQLKKCEAEDETQCKKKVAKLREQLHELKLKYYENSIKELEEEIYRLEKDTTEVPSNFDKCKDWKRLGKDSNSFHIKLFTAMGRISWEDARVRCLDYGGDLVSARDESQYDEIATLIDDQAKDKTNWWFKVSKTAYIGYHQENPNMDFSWLDKKVSTRVRWMPMEPNNQGGEDCTQMISTGELNDIPCSRRLLVSFVCERSASSCHDGVRTVKVTKSTEISDLRDKLKILKSTSNAFKSKKESESTPAGSCEKIRRVVEEEIYGLIASSLKGNYLQEPLPVNEDTPSVLNDTSSGTCLETLNTKSDELQLLKSSFLEIKVRDLEDGIKDLEDAATKSSLGKCDKRWVEFQADFKVKLFKDIGYPVSFEEARVKCLNIGGDLVTSRGRSGLGFIHNMVWRLLGNNKLDRYDEFWIGYKSEAGNGHWLGRDGSIIDNMDRNNMDGCAAFSLKRKVRMTSCTETKLTHFICERSKDSCENGTPTTNFSKITEIKELKKQLEVTKDQLEGAKTSSSVDSSNEECESKLVSLEKEMSDKKIEKLNYEISGIVDEINQLKSIDLKKDHVGKCDESWVKASEGFRVKLFTEDDHVSWEHARGKCVQEGGDLASLRTSSDYSDIQQMLMDWKQAPDRSHRGQMRDPFIGYYNVEGVWKWLDETVTFSPPGFRPGWLDKCAYLRFRSSKLSSRAVRSLRCPRDTSQAYLCERSAESCSSDKPSESDAGLSVLEEALLKKKKELASFT